MVTTVKRPYPEPNTDVYWTNPKTYETLFCWSLPHWSAFNNYLLNPDHYVKEQVADIKAYNAEDLGHFGFMKIGMTKDKIPVLAPTPNFKDRKMGAEKKRIQLFI